MLALDDGSLARLVRAGRDIPYAQREEWLADIAGKLEPKPSTVAVRECRARARAGIRKVLVEVGPDDEELLRLMGVLPDWDADDRRGIGAAVQRLLALLRQNHGLS